MRWADLDERARLWTKPRTKTGTPHVVPLPVQAIAALQALPRTSAWVFAGAHGQPWSCAMAGKLWGTIRRRWGLDDVRLHDLRRTCASYLAREGENLSVIQSTLGHSSLTATAVYSRMNVGGVDRALQGQADRLYSLLSPTAASTDASEVVHETP